mmetsp:Transcript_30395/g.65463  ORF Transcript_30395/g.65463 Transcript_30395/m.65463 type:complete len:98 (+) Transcript_30395:368-661(+)
MADPSDKNLKKRPARGKRPEVSPKLNKENNNNDDEEDEDDSRMTKLTRLTAAADRKRRPLRAIELEHYIAVYLPSFVPKKSRAGGVVVVGMEDDEVS